MVGSLVLSVCKTIVGTVGTLGNVLVCLVIWKVSAMQTRTNAFIFHQAIVDFFGSILNILQAWLLVPDRLPDNFAGWFLCEIWQSSSASFIFFDTSTYNLMAVTLERYFAIVHPFKYHAFFASYPGLKLGAVFSVCWMVGLTINLYGVVHFENMGGVCVSFLPSTIAGVMIIISVYVMPFAVMLFAYIRTSAELKRGAVRDGPSSGQSAGMAESLLRPRRNTFKTLLIVFITFLVCWTPNQVYVLFANVGYRLHFDEWYYVASVILVATNSCINPIIYAFKFNQFRKGLRTLMCRNCRPVGSSDVSSINDATENRRE